MANDFSAIKSLNELKNLLDSGAITQDEYDVLKRKIIFGNENAGTATPMPEPPIPPAAQPVYRSSSVVIPPPGATVPPAADVPPVAPIPPTPVGGNPVTPAYNPIVNEPDPVPVNPIREATTTAYVENSRMEQPEEVIVETKQKDWLLTILITLGVLLLLGLIGYQLLSKDGSEKLTSKSGPETEEVMTEDGQLPEADPDADATASTRSDRIDGAAMPENVPAEGTTTTPEGTATPGPATDPAATAATTPAKPATPTISNEDALSRIQDRLESYYDDVKSAPFNAQRHFASNVERYYILTNTTPSAINDNINSYHFEEFQDSESTIEPGSMKIESNGPNGFEVTYVEYGKAFRKSKGQKQETKARVRARFDPNFKMTYFRQEQLLENKFIDE